MQQREAAIGRFAGMIEQQRRQQDFYRDAIGGASFWKAADQPALEELEEHDRKNDELFVNFGKRWEQRQPAQEGQPEEVNPTYCRSLAIQHSAGLRQSLTRGVVRSRTQVGHGMPCPYTMA